MFLYKRVKGISVTRFVAYTVRSIGIFLISTYTADSRLVRGLSIEAFGSPWCTCVQVVVCQRLSTGLTHGVRQRKADYCNARYHPSRERSRPPTYWLGSCRTCPSTLPYGYIARDPKNKTVPTFFGPSWVLTFDTRPQHCSSRVQRTFMSRTVRTRLQQRQAHMSVGMARRDHTFVRYSKRANICRHLEIHS